MIFKKALPHYLIIANGPFLDKAIIEEAAVGRSIITLDGASRKLIKLGIRPQVILGDFDSVDIDICDMKKKLDLIDEKNFSYLNKEKIEIVPVEDQNMTDLQKAISYCDQHHAASIDIVCATGGRMDHTLSGMTTLAMKYTSERPLRLHTESQMLQWRENCTFLIEGQIGDYCGLFAFDNPACFTSQGLRWEGENSPLAFARYESVANQLTATCATITVQGKVLVVHPARFHAQRHFMQLSYGEQLKRLWEQENGKVK